MGLPDERREEDELVEPLFAGLSGAEEHDQDAAPQDPWKHPRAAPLPGTAAIEEPEAEPATFPLVLKALFLLIVLIAVGAFVYLTIGE